MPWAGQGPGPLTSVMWTLREAANRTILEDVAANDLVIVSAGTDFGEMLGFAGMIFGQTPGS